MSSLNLSDYNFDYKAIEYEDDPFEDVMPIENKKSIIEHMSDYYFTYWSILRLFDCLICLIALAAYIFLICVICKNKRLKSRTDMYILNCAILYTLYLISTVFFFIIFSLFYSYLFEVLALELTHALKMLYFAFALGLALDWFISMWRPNLIHKYNNHYKYLFLALYFLAFISGFVMIFIDYIYNEEANHIKYYITVILYIIILIILIAINVVGKILNLNKLSTKMAYSLAVANMIIFSSVPQFLYSLVYHLTISYNFMIILSYLEILPLFISSTHPIFVVYILGRQNKYFKMAYQRCFKRSVKEYDDENLDEGSVVENDNRNNEIKVNFSNEQMQTQLIIDR